MKKTMKMNEEGGKPREEVYEKNFFQDLGNFFLIMIIRVRLKDELLAR